MGKTLRIKLILIALIFIIITVFGISVVFSFGENILFNALAYGSGSEDDPYRIYDSNQMLSLQEISSSKNAKFYTENKHFVLCNDITIMTRAASTPYGFYGYFDGNGHNLKITDGNIFYKVGEGSIISNLTIDLNLSHKNVSQVYGIAYQLDKGATIKDCVVNGRIYLDFSAFPHRFGVPCRCAAYCINNNGVIRNCKYYGEIICNKPSFSTRYVSGFTLSGNGIIERCEFNGDFNLILNGMGEIIAGLSFKNEILESKFVGDIIITKDLDEEYKNTGRLIQLYGLGQTVKGGLFEGEITSYYAYPKICLIASTESTFEFNGTMKMILEDGEVELLP